MATQTQFVTARISNETYLRLKRQAKREQSSLSRLVRILLERSLNGGVK